MARLEGLLRRGLPVPVGRVPNRRSFLFIENLVSAIQTYLATSNPPTGRAWLVADEDVVSTETIVRAMAAAMNLRARVVHRQLTYLWRYFMFASFGWAINQLKAGRAIRLSSWATGQYWQVVQLPHEASSEAVPPIRLMQVSYDDKGNVFKQTPRSRF